MTGGNLSLRAALRLEPPARIAFSGAGGKTTAIFQLARQLPPPVIVTTTTHLGAWQAPLADTHRIVEHEEELARALAQPSGVMLVTGKEGVDRRLHAPSPDTLRELAAFCKRKQISLLVEADGSRGRPLKAPGDHEPAIPAFVDGVVVTAGLSGLGSRCDEESGAVHRSRRFAELAGLAVGETITPEALARVLKHLRGGLKGIPRGVCRMALLNQADTPGLVEQGRAVAAMLATDYDAVCVAALQQERVDAVYEPVAGILLAAGASSRFGQPKALLDWQGRPLVRRVAEQALAGGVRPLVVVLGAHADLVRSALNDLPVVFVDNPNWESGQSSSLKAGLLAANELTALRRLGAAVFFVADQPFLHANLVRGLIDRHRRTLAPVIAPRVAGRRANPVLFDRVTFAALSSLEGDTGGRAIFDRYPPDWLPWEDQRLLLDVDTPEDYYQIMAAGEGSEDG